MKITVVGGGYVGLVSSVCLAELEHSVTLIEVDKKKVEAINSGVPPIYERGLDELLRRHTVEISMQLIVMMILQAPILHLFA